MLKHKDRLFLAIDQGGHTSRALVFGADGDVHSQGHSGIQTERPQPGWVEHDAEALVTSVQEAISEAVSKLGSDCARLFSAGLATQRSSVVCWDRSTKQALSKVISWQDRRAAQWMTHFQQDAADIHKYTGLFPSPHYGASKLRWCLEHLSKVQTTLEAGELDFGPLASFLISRLCEERKAWADPANASRTLLWNVETRDWDEGLLQKFGIPKECLPETSLSRHPFGHIAIADFRIPLNIVTGDQSAALFQQGPPQNDTVYINIGTGAFLQRIQASMIRDTDRLLSSVVFSDEKHSYYAIEGTVNGAGAALAWFSEEYQIVEDWFEEAETWIHKAKSPPIFINAVGGIASPYWMPQLKSHFIGEGGKIERCTAVIESILFLIQINLEEMNKITDPPNTLMISGGIARLDTVCQRLANLSGIEVVRPEQHEATARGLAFLLSENKRPWLPSTAPLHFSPQKDGALQKRYLTWQRIMSETIEALG